ncbi:MAG: hypothetical protein KM312_10690 [Hydrogenibacillus schlegelii]|uniref:Transposase n=1 Tax=Hydrogenibacillus schlegelii TaxID=1484 RepID=A0A947GA33_HYDSH|nr:hypothetical protein [Hydrogenibacillus schlegelii]
MSRFQAAKRTAYQALRRGKKTGEIVKDLYRKFFPNARWCQWAVEDAEATIESQKEQVKMHVSDLEAKIEKAAEKLERTKDKLHRQGIKTRLEKKHLDAGEAYTVRVVRKDGRFDCFISFPLKSDPLLFPDRNQDLAGIDLNPDVVAVTVALPNGNLKVSRCFFSPDLVQASHEKREWIAGNLANEVADWLASLGVRQVALEELFFAQDHDTNKEFNRITHNFTKKLLFTRLIVALRKRGIAVFTVPAAYTSLIGFFKYAETYGLNAHQAAAFVIARRALGFKEKVPKALIQKLLGRPPGEGWTHWKLWGKLYGMFKATRKKIARSFNIKGFTPSVWVETIFAESG